MAAAESSPATTAYSAADRTGTGTVAPSPMHQASLVGVRVRGLDVAIEKCPRGKNRSSVRRGRKQTSGHNGRSELHLDNSGLGQMVPRKGLEPSRPLSHWHLKPARLPIPPPGPGPVTTDRSRACQIRESASQMVC